MSKGLVIVVAYSAVLVCLFGVSCYLMTIVNPKPISSNGTIIDVIPEEYLPDIKEDVLGYGLETYESKPEVNEYYQRIKTTEPPGAIFPKAATSDPLAKSSYSCFLLDTTTRDIMPDRRSQQMIKDLFRIKGKRSSVDENSRSREYSRAGAVILKILDDDGKTKIEIKVETDAFNDDNLDIKLNEKDETQINESEYKNTVIKILPNNTLALDKPDASVVIDFSTKNANVTKNFTETKPEFDRNCTASTSFMLKTLQNDKLVLFSATNGTEKHFAGLYSTESPINESSSAESLSYRAHQSFTNLYSAEKSVKESNITENSMEESYSIEKNMTELKRETAIIQLNSTKDDVDTYNIGKVMNESNITRKSIQQSIEIKTKE